MGIRKGWLKRVGPTTKEKEKGHEGERRSTVKERLEEKAVNRETRRERRKEVLIRYLWYNGPTSDREWAGAEKARVKAKREKKPKGRVQDYRPETW